MKIVFFFVLISFAFLADESNGAEVDVDLLWRELRNYNRKRKA